MMTREPISGERHFGNAHDVFEYPISDEERIAREREYWRFDPYEDIGPLFYSDLYEASGERERWADWA